MAFTKEEANASDSIKYQVAHIYLGKCHVCGQTEYMPVICQMCFVCEMRISMLWSPKCLSFVKDVLSKNST